jgi:transposase InsO family protein
VYKAGSDNPADYMSRHPYKSTGIASREEKVAEEYINFLTRAAIPKAMTLDELQSGTQSDPTLQAVIVAIKSGSWILAPDTTVSLPAFETYSKLKDELSVSDEFNLVLRQRRLVVPDSLRKRAVQLAHEGHQGLTKTKALIREKVWFPGIDKMVEEEIRLCLPCQVATPANSREPLKMSALPKAAWREVSVDFASVGSEYLLVITDDYSRFPVIHVISSLSAKVVIPKLDRTFSEFGIPDVVKSDNGPPFSSHEFKQFAIELGFRHRKITPLWPRANAEVERFMKTIKKVIKAATVSQSSWKSEMHRFLRNYRSTPHCTTGVPPATALFGRSMNIKIPQVSDMLTTPVEFRSRDFEKKQRMKNNADNKSYVKPSDLKIGDTVLVKNPPVVKKSETPFEHDTYQVTNKNGSMLTARNKKGREVTRNSSFFKRVDPNIASDQDRDVNIEQETVMTEETPPEDAAGPDGPPNVVDQNDVGVPANIEQSRRREIRKPAWLNDYVS